MSPEQGDSMDDHVASSRWMEMIDGKLRSDEIAEVYGHLAFCEDCAGLIRALSEVRGDFEAAWEGFLATLAGTGGLPASSAAPAPIGSEAAAASRVSVALRVLVDRARAIAAIATEGAAGLPSLGPFRITPVALPAGAGDPNRSVDSTLAEIQIVAPTIGSATVVADAKRNAISVLLRPPAGMALADMLRDLSPRAILMDPEGRRRRESTFMSVEGADYLLAEFEQLEQIHWVIGLEFGR